MTVPRPMRHAVLALGSNLGDRRATLDAAVADLRSARGIRVGAVSSYRESVALTLHGRDAAEPRYLNAIVLVDTVLDPHALLRLVNRIEAKHGRVRTARWGARTLDIDIVAIDEQRISEPDLIVPHPRAAERDFVLAPWAEVDPDAIIPGVGRVADLLRDLRDTDPGDGGGAA